jgi:uncharacterized membrane protein YfcA
MRVLLPAAALGGLAGAALLLLTPERAFEVLIPFLIVVAVVAALLVLLLPSLVAYRYTAPQQRGEFVTRPWRGWIWLDHARTARPAATRWPGTTTSRCGPGCGCTGAAAPAARASRRATRWSRP